MTTKEQIQAVMERTSQALSQANVLINEQPDRGPQDESLYNAVSLLYDAVEMMFGFYNLLLLSDGVLVNVVEWKE